VITKSLKIAIYLFVSLGFSASIAGAYEDFFRALNTNDGGTVRSLLARGFDPNSPDEKGQVALYVALRAESPAAVSALLEHPNLKVDAVNLVGETPLMMAALRGNLAAAQALVAKGGNVNREGWTPLHYAATGPEAPVVAFLLDRGARIDAVSPIKSTPLMMAAKYGSEASVDLLLARGADPKWRNEAGQGAAEYARQGGREALAARLEKLTR
jgi:uncharacterized protein